MTIMQMISDGLQIVANIGALVVAFLVWFGFSRRLEKLEDSTIKRDVCLANTKGFESVLESIEKRLDRMEKKLDSFIGRASCHIESKREENIS